jgi:valyl-tRNA synthetase
VQSVLEKLARLASIEVVSEGGDVPPSATALVGNMEIHIPMAGLIDKDAELARLSKAIDKVRQDIARTQGKLGNERFVANAPAEVIEKERVKLDESEKQLDKLLQQQTTISAL